MRKETPSHLSDIVPLLPHVNASLNAVATVLLVVGYVLIKRRQEEAHKWVMLACFGVSAVFLCSYLTYHFNIVGGSKTFPSSDFPSAAYVYFPILISHIFLAVTVPFLAVGTIYLGLAEKRQGHRRLAKWTFPIWLYVSVTGVIVYLML
ncbi:MAG: DUF420 domain-containing protein, partial [Pirellulaceae bacterium]|nr:DUF420 domain-containing protein [Pirellulaceae bacterium]